MKRRLVVPLLFFIFLVPLFQAQATIVAPSFIDEDNVALNTADNNLSVSFGFIDNIRGYGFTTTSNCVYGDVKINITAYRDVNGTWHDATLTRSRWITGGFSLDSTLNYSFTFEDLRPSANADAVRGYVVLTFSVGSACGSWYGDGYTASISDHDSYYAVNIYENGNLLSVFGVGKESITKEFELNFTSGQITYSGSATSLPAEWRPVEGCISPHIPKLGGFDIVYYASNPSVASGVLGRVADIVRQDSHNLSWIENIEIRDAVDFESLASSHNKTVSELTPADFDSYVSPPGKVTILDVGEIIDIGASGVAAPGIIFTVSPSEDILLHELSHQAGFCDPSPYKSWKDFWDSYVMPETSAFTNETWYTKIDDIKLWVTLSSEPICPASKETKLEFTVRSNEAVTVSWELDSPTGSFSPSSGTLEVDPVGTIETIYVPDPTEGITTTEVTLTITLNGESRVFSFPLMILPDEWFQNTSISNVTGPIDFNEYKSTLPHDLMNLYENLSSQIADLENGNWSNADALASAERARLDFEAARQDLQRAMQTNDTCTKRLWMDAAKYRQIAANYWLLRAKDLETFGNIAGVNWVASQILGDENAKRMAESYERKALTFEMQAQMGCPQGILSSGYGISPLIAFYSALSSSIGTNNVKDLVYWGLLIFGGLLFLIGIIQAVATKGKRWQLILVGLLLIFLAFGFSTFGFLLGGG